MPRGTPNNPGGKNQYPKCGMALLAYLSCSVAHKCTDMILIVPATDERLKTALFEYSRLNITSPEIIKQYLFRDHGIDMRFVCLFVYLFVSRPTPCFLSDVLQTPQR